MCAENQCLLCGEAIGKGKNMAKCLPKQFEDNIIYNMKALRYLCEDVLKFVPNGNVVKLVGGLFICLKMY